MSSTNNRPSSQPRPEISDALRRRIAEITSKNEEWAQQRRRRPSPTGKAIERAPAAATNLATPAKTTTAAMMPPPTRRTPDSIPERPPTTTGLKISTARKSSATKPLASPASSEMSAISYASSSQQQHAQQQMQKPVVSSPLRTGGSSSSSSSPEEALLPRRTSSRRPTAPVSRTSSRDQNAASAAANADFNLPMNQTKSTNRKNPGTAELDERRERLRIIEETRARLMGTNSPIMSPNDPSTKTPQSMANNKSNSPPPQSSPPPSKAAVRRAPNTPLSVSTKSPLHQTFWHDTPLQSAHIKEDHAPSPGKMDKLRAELEDANLELMKLEDELERQKTKHAHKQADYDSRLMAATNDYQELKREFDELLSRQSPVQRSLSDEDAARIRQLESELADERRHVETLEQEITQKQNHITSLEERLSELKQRLEEAVCERSHYQEEMNRGAERVKMFETRVLDLETEVNAKQSAHDSLLKEMRDLEQLNADLVKKTDTLANLHSQLADAQEKISMFEERVVDSDKQRELFMDAQRHVEELSEQTRELRRENESLRRDLSTTPKSIAADESMILAMDALKKENRQLLETVRQLEDYITELTDMYNKSSSSSARRNEVASPALSKKSDKSNGSASEIKYVSNDEELLQFIETMSLKTESYRNEIDELRQENERLKRGTNGNVNGDSSGVVVKQVKRELADSLERERQLDVDYNALLGELERMSTQLVDAAGEKKRVDAENEELRTRLAKVQERLEEAMVQQIGREAAHESNAGGVGGAASSTVVMRKQMKRLLADIRQEYEEYLALERKERAQAESEIRNLRRERDQRHYEEKLESVRLR